MVWHGGRSVKPEFGSIHRKARFAHRTLASRLPKKFTSLSRSNVPCARPALVPILRPLATRAHHATRCPCRAGDTEPERPKVTGPSFGRRQDAVAHFVSGLWKHTRDQSNARPFGQAGQSRALSGGNVWFEPDTHVQEILCPTRFFGNLKGSTTALFSLTCYINWMRSLAIIFNLSVFIVVGSCSLILTSFGVENNYLLPTAFLGFPIAALAGYSAWKLMKNDKD